MVWLIRNKYAWCMYRFILILKPRRVHWLRIFNRKHMVDGSNAFFAALPFPIRSLFLHRMCCASTMNHSMQMYSHTHTHRFLVDSRTIAQKAKQTMKTIPTKKNKMCGQSCRNTILICVKYSRVCAIRTAQSLFRTIKPHKGEGAKQKSNEKKKR